MFVLILSLILFPSFVINQDFFTVQLAPSTLTSVPYLNGEITVYEHRANQSRYYLPPLAVLQINDTQVLFNRFTNRYSIRLALVLFTDELHQVVLSYLQKTLKRCQTNTPCQIKMMPIDRLRIVWKRIQALSTNYELDSSWISNTILLSTIYFNIDCTTQSACIHLQQDILQYPQIIDGLELEYSTPTEKHLRREVTIMGSHVMKTNMFASLKQMYTTTDTNTRYLLADDMNMLISEVLANVEMSDVTDAGYVSHDDQILMRDLLKNRIALNQEVLLGHKARQWESVYWNSDNIRPDLTVKLLNEQLSRQDNQGSKENQIEIDQDKNHFNQSASTNNIRLYDDDSKKSLSTNNTGGSTYSDKSNSQSSLSDAQSANIQDSSSSSSSSQSQNQANSGHVNSGTRTAYNRAGSAGFLSFSGSIGSSSDITSANSNSHSSSEGKSNSNSESNRNMLGQQQRNLDYKDGSQNQVDGKTNQNFFQQGSSTTDIHARNLATSDYKKMIDMDNFAARHLDKSSLGKYEENRQYLEYHGNKFEVKPVTAYRINLGQFHESLKLVSKSIVVQRIDSIHAIPIRAIGDPIVLTPMLERYK
jgi:hypothetical protein